MPNWADVEVNITFENSNDASKFVDDFNGKNNGKKGFEAVIPMPDELLNVKCPTDVISDKDFNELEDDEKTWYISESHANYLKEKHDAINWYDWAIKNWGVKWNVNPGDVHIERYDNYVDMSFSSPWDAPMGWAKTASEKYKCFINIKALEPGSDFFRNYEFDEGV